MRHRNPEWTIDGEQVTTDWDADGWYYDWANYPREGPFSTEQEALKDAMGEVAKRERAIGTIGDVNPIEYDGGIIYQKGDPPRYRMIYFQHYGEDDGQVSVYGFDIEDDVIKDLNWADWEQIAESFGADVDELKAMARSPDPFERAWVYESVGGYDGFSNLDGYADDMTVEHAEKMYGADLEEAKSAEAERRERAYQRRRRNPRRKKKRSTSALFRKLMRL